MKHPSIILLIGLSLCLFLSCNNRVAYHSFLPIDTEGWDKKDPLEFDVPRLQQSGQYQLELTVRTTNTYPYTSLVLQQEIQTHQRSKRQHIERQTVVVPMVDKEGKRLSKGIGQYEYTVLTKQVSLAQGDSLAVFYHHHMQREVLPGISEIGIRLKQLQP